MLKPSTTFFRHEPQRSQLLNELWNAQERDGYITEKTMEELAKSLDISQIEIEGIVSFYHFFHTQPTARHVIYLNSSIISKVKGYERIREALERETGTRFNTSDRTGTFALFDTPCIGLSDQEPAALIDFHPFTNLNVMKVREIISALKSGKTASEICDAPEDHIRYLPPNNHTVFFRPYIPGEAIGRATSLSPEKVIDIVKTSELSGRGGAFLPTWIKWDGCRKEAATPKYVVCNADEGEPGTFKDRVLLNKEPGSVLEGMIIAGYAIGAKYGIIYLRAEYKWLLKKLEATIQDFYDQKLLGRSILGMADFDFDIRIQVGAGSYVCGEETALLESVEGKRGEPRTKWYFPVQRGYLQKPTIINNVETFAAVARMLEMGINNYLNRGIPGSPGTKLISLSGDVERPGIYEIEWGMTIQQLLKHAGAVDPYYIQLSGPSGECISMNQKHRKISMRDLMATQDIRCGGSFMVLNRQRDIMKILLNFSAFFLKESCGICTPCRAGNYIIHKKLEKMAHGLATRADVEEMHQWCNIMKETSRCGLGKTAYNTPLMAIEEFSDYFIEKLEDAASELNHKFNMEEAISDYENTKSDKRVTITIDGQPHEVVRGQNLVDAAKEQGVFIPSLCYFKHIDPPLGTCRACTCKVNGRNVPACMQRVEEGMAVEVNTAELKNTRKALVEMMFAEGNHFCPSCVKSGDCDLQHMAYELGVTHVRFPHLFRDRPTDNQSRRMVLENNRCIKCRRCVEEVFTDDGKRVFMYQNRGIETLVGIDYEQEARLTEKQAEAAMNLCPTGAIVVRGKRLAKPFGLRSFDRESEQEDFAIQWSASPDQKPKTKKTVATVSLAGCFGCHMSLLDIDEEILDLVDLVDFHKSPLTDIKKFKQRCDLGIVEGGCCNTENIETLREFRANCDVLVAVGECAIWGGLPAMRNTIPLGECLEEAFINAGTNVEGESRVPYHEDLPKLLNRVYACNEIVKIDYLIPGCPPSASHMWKVIRNILWGEEFSVLYHEFKYD